MENKKKVLITTTTPYMIKSFLMNDIKTLQELGYEVEVGTNYKTFNVISEEELEKFKWILHENNVKINQIDFTRSIFDIKSLIKSYIETKKLLNKEKYTLIHTHTPIGGLITRVAFKHSQIYNDSKMIYTAHGFHFFKGNNLFKNILFRNIEKYGARFTDTLITINKEDYEAAKKFRLKKNGKVEYIPGVGIDIKKIKSIKGNKQKVCEDNGIPLNSTLLISVGELNENKNHKIIIESLPFLPSNTHYLICGIGPLKEMYLKLGKELGVENRLHLLGYRNDVINLIKSSDIFIFPSKREGLSVALMEALACEKPCVVSKIRGNVDLVQDNGNGILVEIQDVENWKKAIQQAIEHISDFDIRQNWANDIQTIKKRMKEIYCLNMKEK